MLLDPDYAPFTLALGLLAGLVLLELGALMIGTSLMGDEAESPLAEPQAQGAPLMIRAAAFLLGFGSVGLIVQSLVAPPPFVAPGVALILGIGFSRAFSRLFARALPRITTTATSAQFMGGLQGLVTQGTARRGSAAEVRLRDRHGNLHHFRLEPLNDADIIPEGTEVMTVRRREGTQFILRIIPLS